MAMPAVDVPMMLSVLQRQSKSSPQGPLEKVQYDKDGCWTCGCGKLFRRTRNGCNVRQHRQKCDGKGCPDHLRRLRSRVVKSLKMRGGPQVLRQYREGTQLLRRGGMVNSTRGLTGGELRVVVDDVVNGRSLLKPGVLQSGSLQRKSRRMPFRVSHLIQHLTDDNECRSNRWQPTPSVPVRVECPSWGMKRERCVGSSCSGPPCFAKACFAGP